MDSTPISVSDVKLDDKKYVVRNGQRFEKKSSKTRSAVTNGAPDADFCADSFIKLSRGVTAYRLIEPSTAKDETVESLPVAVLLHGMYTSSYMWADVADLLCDCEQGPNCRVLVFDFYGRGRSPWTGVQCTLDCLVTQTKELLDVLYLTKNPIYLIGFDMGGSVATGFAAKYSSLCTSLTLIAPMGAKYATLKREAWLARKYFGEYMIYKRRTTLPAKQEEDFFETGTSAPHRPMIDKQVQMVQWQVDNTPGYLGAILSGIRYFPLRGMEELYTAVGRHYRPVLIIWGDHDRVAPYRKSMEIMEECFPSAFLVDIRDCGHNAVLEKFDEAMTEILAFHKMTSDKLKSDGELKDFEVSSSSGSEPAQPMK